MEVKRSFDILEHIKNEPATLGNFKFAEKIEGKWKTYNIDDYINFANNFSYGLLALGLNKGYKLATITENCPQWNFVDMGASQIGVTHVTIYPTISNEETEYILKHSDTQIVIVSDKNMYKRIKPIIDKLQNIEIYTFNQVENAKNWNEILELGEKSKIYFNSDLEKIKKSIHEDDLLTLIYTSGTTGVPKGVMLTHKNLISNVINSSTLLHLDYNHKVLSFLPLSHVFEHMTSYQYQYKGISVYYAESLATVAQNIKELQVDGFITVPRLLESIYEKINSKASTLKGIKKSIFKWSLKIAAKYVPFQKQNPFYKIKHKIADKLVFSKWRAVLSPNLIFIGCGGSSLQPRLSRLFWAAGLPVFEGYGLTETSPVLTVNYNQPGKIKIGSVGTKLTNVEIKFGNDGEILAKAPSIMKGYYKDEESTKQVFDEQGWFHTGDIGSFDDEGFLRITDRKKEIFKMSNGKYIAPQVIENKLKESFLISQTMVVGENQKFPSVLISPNFEQLKNWCIKNKINFENRLEMITKPKVIAFFQSEINKLNQTLGQFEQVKRFKLVAEEWSSQTGELSPTLKLKRRVLVAKYKSLIENIYFSNKIGAI